MGKFIVIEGIDGSGKTTLAKYLTNQLNNKGLICNYYSEPTEYPTGKKLREYLRGVFTLTPKEELELFIEDRKESVQKNILPSLQSHDFTILDRYFYSTAAYQWKTGIPPEDIIQLNLKENFPIPNYLLYLKINPQYALERIYNRKKEIFESIQELQIIQERYEKVLPSNTIFLDSMKPVEELANEVLKIIL